MKKLTTLLLATLSVANIAFADTQTQHSSASDRISNFLAGGPGSTLCQQTSAPCFSYTSSQQVEHNWGIWSGTDFSSLSGTFTSFFDQHRFDPQSLDHLQAFINTLHLDPTLLSRLEMLVQSLRDDHFNWGWNSGCDENGDNDNAENDHDGDFCDGEPVPVPEPSTLAAFLTGAALLGGAMIRRSRRGR